MAKKTASDAHGCGFDSVKCEYRLKLCKKEFNNIEDKVEDVKNGIKDNLENHREEMQRILEAHNESMAHSIDNSYNNLKNKIIVTEKSIGEKIDSLIEFNTTLKGNGSPGVFEKLRKMKWQIRIGFVIITFLVVLIFGGNIKGVNLDSIKKTLRYYGGIKHIYTDSPGFKKNSKSISHILVKDPNIISK